MKKLLLTLAMLIASSVPSLRAGTLVPLGLDRLSNEAQLVLHGTVRAKSCQLDSEGRIYTRVELDVSEVWKGSLTNRAFTVVHSGGVYGNRRASAPHQVEFQSGEEVVVFLAINRRGEGVCLGMAQGKFQVWQDAASKQKFVRNVFYGNTEGKSVAGIDVGRARRSARAEDALEFSESDVLSRRARSDTPYQDSQRKVSGTLPAAAVANVPRDNDRNDLLSLDEFRRRVRGGNQ